MADAFINAVEIAEPPVSLDELSAIAHGAPVELTNAAVSRIETARRVVEDALDGDDLVYGLNTGLGHMRDEPLPLEALKAMQPVMVAMHEGLMGEPLPADVVRAAMAARLVGISRGGSGATLAAAATLQAMLNAGVHPVVRAIGSVGAADLAPMAAIAMVAIGAGEAEYAGQEMPGADALDAAGIEPLEMEPKDALALVSANGVTLGHGALVLERCRYVLALADVVAAVSMEAYGANPTIVEPVVAAAKSSEGQIETSNRIRTVLEGSSRTGPGAELSVQDPLAYRVVPQVHGTARDVMAFAVGAFTTELNSMADNPLVSVEDGRLISNGNFHPMLPALALESLRVALAHVGQLSDRRSGHLWDGFLAEPPEFELGPSQRFAPEAAGLLLRYAAAARVTALYRLANPVTLDMPILDLGVEDHATNAPEAVRSADESLDVIEDLLTVELMIADAVLDALDPAPRLGVGTGSMITALRRLLAGIPAGTPASAVHEGVKAQLPNLLS